MTSDFEVNITGLPFDKKGISGVTIQYGFNMIPAAMVALNVPYVMENAPAFFENPTQFKKSTKKSMGVSIDIKSVTGCLTFKGYFDGLSIVQTPGGMQYTAVIKNKFQILTEMYPKMMGMYPGSMLVSRYSPNLEYEPGGGEGIYSALKIAGMKIDAGKSPPDFYKEFLKKCVESQESETFWATTPDLSAIMNIVRESGQAYKDNLKLCKELLESGVDTTYAKSSLYFCNRDLPYHANLVASAGDDAWELLLTTMADAGCILLASNEKLYVVPQSNFMKLDGPCPKITEQSLTPNTAFPADYNNFVLNDNSYKNIKYCFVSAVGNTTSITSRNQAVNLQNLGRYPQNESDINPDDGASGIFLTHCPPWLGRTIGNVFVVHSENASGNQEKPYTEVGKKKEVEEIDEGKSATKEADKKHDSKYGSAAQDTKDILNKYAKARFLMEKYIERTGSFSLQFNPQWVPGTTGFLASRQPKVMFNFYVTGVTHSIELSNGRVGSASSQVTFNSARYGGNAGQIPSTDSNELYQYDSGKMKALQKSWLGDNKASFKPRPL